MSSGYTALFSTMLEGTLYGKWPHTGIWPCLLSQMDRYGVIDKTPQCLAAAIGVPVELLMEVIDDFMQPDPDSRTGDNDGRRLVLIDQRRSWGWRVVNAQKYREKARKKEFDAERTSSGVDAARKAAERAKADDKKDVPTRPDASREIPLSSHLRANNNKEEFAAARAVVGLNLEAFDTWIQYRTEIRKPVKPASLIALAKKLASLGNQQTSAVQHSIASGYMGLFAPKDASPAQAPIQHRQSREFPS